MLHACRVHENMLHTCIRAAYTHTCCIHAYMNTCTHQTRIHINYTTHYTHTHTVRTTCTVRITHQMHHIHYMHCMHYIHHMHFTAHLTHIARSTHTNRGTHPSRGMYRCLGARLLPSASGLRGGRSRRRWAARSAVPRSRRGSSDEGALQPTPEVALPWLAYTTPEPTTSSRDLHVHISLIPTTPMMTPSKPFFPETRSSSTAAYSKQTTISVMSAKHEECIRKG